MTPVGGSDRPARPDPRTIDPDHFRLERYLGPGRRPLKTRAYYAARPVLPRRVQIALRRLYARRQARRDFPAWPIEPLLVDQRRLKIREAIRSMGGGRLPLIAEWPDEHRFAVIITHDVEGPAGVANVGRLLDVERHYGLVSSWNFVAEWYPLSDQLFDHLRAAGCEIGVHGITHDAKLFASRESFERALPQIQHYLAAWGAVGFRSPATHRNSAWMPRLGCLYDSSFPDTDPFEPQPGGCCSILPFTIDSLVELPITLVQDHTLWEILRDESIDLWRYKGDWIIANRGLINVIVHPDYVLTESRLKLFEELCAYLRDRIDSRHGWHALPRDVAAWWKSREGLELDPASRRPQILGPPQDPWTERAKVVFAYEQDGELTFAAGSQMPA